MELRLSLFLPRDVLSVAVVRHICSFSLREIGVADGCVNDVEIALTEACTNVVDHSGPGDEYEVEFHCDDEQCTIRVVDRGRGFDFSSLLPSDGRPSDGKPADGLLPDERGRGIGLMNALVDRIKFVSKPEEGTIVHLEKDLEYRTGAPIGRLSTSGAGRVDDDS